MERLDKVKYLKRVITVAWIALALCFVIKLFGGNLFEIVCHNETFIAICNYADSHLLASYLIGIFHTFISINLFCLAILGTTKHKTWHCIVIVATVLVGTAVKMLFTDYGWIFDIWQVVAMPILFLGKRYKEYYKVLVANVLLIAFQLVSLITKNIAIGVITTTNGLVISLIYSIDVTIMLVLYMLYSNLLKTKKEVK